MKKLFLGFGLLLGLSVKATAAPLYGYVRITTTTALTPTLQSGAINIASGTVQNLTLKYGVNAATGVFSGAVTAASFSPASALTALLASTNTWTAGQTFSKQITISSNVLDGSSTQGTAGQSLQSNAGSAPTWVSVPSAILSATSAWTGAQTFNSSTSIQGSLLAKSLNPGTTFDYLLSQSSNTAPTWSHAGLILQSVQFTAAASSATTSATFIPTNITLTIAPKFTTSKINLHFSGTLRDSAVATDSCQLTIARGGTNLAGTNGFAEISGNAASIVQTPISVMFQDSPATTSSTVYAVYIRNTAGTVTCTLNSNVTGVLRADELGQ